MTCRTGNRRDVTIQGVKYEMLNEETKEAATCREQCHPVAKRMSETIHYAKGCRNMYIEQCQDGAIMNAITTSETVKARQCREVKMKMQGLDVTMPEMGNATVTNSIPIPSELRDLINKFNIVTYRKGKASPHTVMV